MSARTICPDCAQPIVVDAWPSWCESCGWGIVAPPQEQPTTRLGALVRAGVRSGAREEHRVFTARELRPRLNWGRIAAFAIAALVHLAALVFVVGGVDLHAHTIRAVAKLTSDRVSILHAELLELVERTLPARFGGSSTDYQLVETEDLGVPRVDVRVSPRVGPIDDRDVVAAVLAAVAEGPSWRTMVADWWADGNTLRVLRENRSSPRRTSCRPFDVSRTDRLRGSRHEQEPSNAASTMAFR